MALGFPTFLFLILVGDWRSDTPSFPDEDRKLLLAGLTDIKKETIDGSVVVESGKVPEWLNGNFIRHSCGVFGNTEHMSENPLNYIGHLFDCMEMGTKFRIENGVVTFTNRWYDTNGNDFFDRYGRDMDKSSNFLQGAYADINVTQLTKFSQMYAKSDKVNEVPHVSWWQIGNKAIAMTEAPIGVIIDPNNVKQAGQIQYTDDNLGFGYKPGVVLTDNPAHEHTEKDGTLWSTVNVAEFTSRTTLKQWQVVYKVGADKNRQLVGKYPFADVDLTRCSRPDAPYPDMNARYGYLHSFSMTENFIILPTAAYLFDPCAFVRNQVNLPFFKRFFTFEPKGPSRLLVMNKSDGKFVKAIETRPFFATHQLGSYEEGELIHMDMLMYNDSSIYTYTTYVKSILSENVYFTDVMRITINRTDWSHSFKNLRGNAAPQAFEMSNINYAYNTKKYTYAYMVRNFDRIGLNAITKLNVDTGVEIEYVFPKGVFAQEPQFIPKPGALFEDDGVILTQGTDGRKKKAFLTILDARTMQLIAHVTAPDNALFGLHNRFFPFEVGQKKSPAVGIFG